ncbi:MAG TPA: SoxR reducing system RseC family protein [Tissierellaceae bacterium]|nr:SoxR reducing system RseC family protein [Tissierellaceae bacterium]
MDQVGVITKTFDDKAEIEVKRTSACGENCKGCGSSCNTPNHIIVLKNNIGAEVGDMVEIKGETKAILKYMMIIYFIPFAMMLVGIFMGIKVFKEMGLSNYEPLSFLVGLITLALGYLIVKLFDIKLGKKENKIIAMTKIL